MSQIVPNLNSQSNKHHHSFALALGLAIFLLPNQATAATVQVHFDANIFPTAVERTVDGMNWFGTTLGIFKFTRTGGDYSGFNVSEFYAICIEPREFVSVGTTYTYEWNTLANGATNINGMGEIRANQLRELYGRYFPVFDNSLTEETAGALQAATWEIVRETSGTLNVLDGTTQFRSAANPNTLILAQTYLNSLNGSGNSLSNLSALTLVGAQDLVVQYGTPIPEPATTLIVGAGLILLPFLRRK